MKQRLFYYAVFILLALHQPTSARDGVEVLDSTGMVQREIQSAPSPTPGFCYWEKETAAGTEFHATNGDGSGNIDCLDPWLAHCDSDSLAYRGSWPSFDWLYLLNSTYRANLNCTVELSVPTGLVASRAIIGNLDINKHTLMLVFPDGAEVQLLAPGTGPDHVQLDLDPGTYRVFLTVEAVQNKLPGMVIDPYEGGIVLKWEDPLSVALEEQTWGAVKSLFR